MIKEISTDSLKQYIRNIPDFPIEGIQFKDITTLLKQPELFSMAVDTIADFYAHERISKVVCIESRGFILGGAIAARLRAGFVPIRKPGKLPAEVFSREYSLEYGKNKIEIHQDAIDEGDIVLLHDDLLASGGTALAAIDLLSHFKIEKIFLCFLCELDFLKGRNALTGNEIYSLIHY
jgi:adenine phosphoribosyltransferase